ncbi:hypothetical protein GGF46_003798 [Coemansia sp. RSA 552]|nr:hypothetical protein GGF46_003798 [Coemansia sp. RSA 552]
MSSARLRERQRLQIATAEEDVARLEAHVRELQSSIDYHYQTHMGMHGGPPQLTEGSAAEFVSEQQSKRRRSTEQPPTSRFAISFLLDKSSDA